MGVLKQKTINPSDESLRIKTKPAAQPVRDSTKNPSTTSYKPIINKKITAKVNEIIRLYPLGLPAIPKHDPLDKQMSIKSYWQI